MMPKRKGPPAPPLAVSRAGKRKEHCTKAINLVSRLIADCGDNDDGLRIALQHLKEHKTKLTTL